ncbi:MAG: VWA domain-containing protein [Chloroflexi bacterium]|nr:VWA domain-containing protein [Chloroflexota bacterium]
MRKPSTQSKLLALIILLSLLLPAVVFAQADQPSAYVNDMRGPTQVQNQAGLPGLALELDFTILDAQGEVLPTAEAETGFVVLGNGESFNAQISKAEDPWSIVFLLDASKTMAAFSASPAFKAARTALADSIGQAPRGSNFAVVTFDDQPKTAQDFTKDGEKVAETIRKKITAKNSGNSCLYAGAYEAVSKLSGASGRRAVIIVTASTDTCGNRLPQDVIDLAKQNHIMIYSVGLKGYSATEQELDSLASATGGLASMREQDELVFAFENIMNGLNVQWRAKATVYPPAGEQAAHLSVTLKDGTIIESQPVTFVSNQDFVRPPEISLKGTVQSTAGGLTFNLIIVSPDLISQLTISVVSKKTGNPVVTQEVTEFTETYKVPANNLDEGEEYTLIVSAIDSKGQVLSQTGADFQFEPPQSALAITQVELSTGDQPAFVIEVNSENLEGVVKFKISLVSMTGNTTVPGSTQTIPAGEPLTIPVENLETGSYKVTVQALDGENVVLAQATSDEIQYERPNALDQAIQWISKTPLALVGVTLLCGVALIGLAVIVWMVMPKPSAKMKTVEMVLPEKQRRAAPIDDSMVIPAPRRAPEREPKPVQRPAPPVQPAASSLPKACIRGYAPADLLRMSAEVTKSPFTIGRREDNDLVVKVDNTLGVSGHHAMITFTNGRFHITDDKSTYGVIVKDAKIQPGVAVPLEDGMIIGLGPKVKIQFYLRPCN